MNKRLSLIFFLICLGISSVNGQSENDFRNMSAFEVKVTEAGTGTPIEMATVYLVPAGDSIVTSFSFTDKNGKALLKGFTAGKYTVNIQFLGFKPYAENTVFEPKTVKKLSVALKEDFESLNGATITEMGDLVTMKGDTLTYNATAFHTGNNASLGELLKKMPGIEVANGRVCVNGEPISRITVEGKTFFFNDQSKALENLPAFIVNKINIFNKNSNKNNERMEGAGEKEMDVRLKEEYREAWFGRVSAEGGVSIRNKSKKMLDESTDGLYNSKIYAQFYGKDDYLTLIGGGNNISNNQLSRIKSGISNIASGGVNYNTSRISGYDTGTSATYDFHDNTDRTASCRTSFISSGKIIEINRNRTSNEISHSAKANLRFGVPQVSPEGFTVTGQLLYHKRTKTDESNSSTVNSNNGEELNRSASRTYGDSDDITANVNLEAKYYLDKKDKHQIRFGGDIGYDGSYGNSSQSSVIRFSSTSEDHGILYTNKSDKLRLNGYMNYNVSLSRYWLLLASAAAAYYTVQDNKDAKNAADCSQNDYYSRNATDKRANLRQTISIRYQGRGDGNSFSTDFGLCIYEDNITHFSKALIAKQFESSNNCWQLSAGPQLGMSLRKGSWRYSFFSSGKSVVPQYGETSNTVPDFSNPIDISIGNIYLKTSYHQDAKLSVSCGSRNAGNSFFDIRLSGAMDLNKITKASWYDRTAIRYSIPVNAKSPSFNAILNATYLKSLNKKKSLNLTIVPKVNFSTGTIYVSDSQPINIDQEKFNYSDMIKNLYGDKSGNEFYSGRSGFIENRTQNLNWVMNAGLKYELQKCSITSGATAANTIIWYSKFPNVKVNNWLYNAYAEALWQSNKGWEIEGRFEANWHHGFSNNYNKPVWLLNMRIAKEIKSFTISLSMYDLLGSSRSFSHVSTAEYIEDTYMSNRGRCILAGFSYNFGKWNLGKKTRMELIEKERNL